MAGSVVTATAEAALAYARAGALVLPLHTPTPSGCSCRHHDCGRNTGKHPRTMRGLDDATSDVAEIERWWSMWPSANVAVRPHPGTLVLDVDPRNGGGTVLLRLQAEHGELPPTQTARTGGGLHLWFGYHGPARASIGPGLDIKTNTGYVVMPPSRHASGNRYEWINEADGIQPAPQWLVELLTPATIPLPTTTGSASPARAEALLRVVREAQPGERNRRLYWACCRAVEAGLGINPLVAAAVEIGLTVREAEATARSAAKQRAVA